MTSATQTDPLEKYEFAGVMEKITLFGIMKVNCVSGLSVKDFCRYFARVELHVSCNPIF